MKFLDEDEAKTFLKAAEGDPLEALYVLAITTGMRLGEITGLLWQDVDLKEKRISVCRSLAIINNRPALQETKTASSRRSVELGNRCVTALLQHRARLNVIPHGASPVFSDSLGGLLRPQNLRRRSFYPLLKRAKLDRIRFHDLRHTCATLLLQGKTAPKVVTELLGHSSVAFTLDIYAHVIPGMQREAVDELDERLA
ncbi:MAG: site-specific integrase [Myxococcota bacterium]|nr:site-specific integrase [Myxococcota bacterium]